jgi:biotin synthase
MAGLGETEGELVSMMGRLQEWGVTVALFAFTPIPGTEMADEPPPSMDSYRRIQVAQYLISRSLRSTKDFTFSPEGRIVSFGMPEDELREVLANGKAFETSGCPGCNRPYYNEPPSGPLYNYPRSLTPREAQQAIEEALSSRADLEGWS